jgi:hypothetical protein
MMVVHRVQLQELLEAQIFAAFKVVKPVMGQALRSVIAANRVTL